ncbi:MAG: acetate uptake transporter [Syntrophotaleaceae bacterium]
MNDGIRCSYYGKDENSCDVGCGYISPSDVATIIKYCSSNYRACSKYQELIDRCPAEAVRDMRQAEMGNQVAGIRDRRQPVSGRPLVKPFKVKWPLPFLGRHVSSRSFRDHRPSAGSVLIPEVPPKKAMQAPAITHPAPLGLLGFGMATVLVNLHNAGFLNLSALMLAIGIFYGGLAQIITGIMEFRRDNTFGATAFISYGLFWLTLVALVLMPRFGLGPPPSGAALVAYLSMWGIFTAALFLGSLKMALNLRIFFGFLTLLFVMLAVATATNNDMIRLAAGYQGIFTGILAIYAGLVQVVREVYRNDGVAVRQN